MCQLAYAGGVYTVVQRRGRSMHAAVHTRTAPRQAYRPAMHRTYPSVRPCPSVRQALPVCPSGLASLASLDTCPLGQS